jgi:hypothetical protein
MGLVEGFGKAQPTSAVVAVWGNNPALAPGDGLGRPAATQVVMRRDEATPGAGFGHWSASTIAPPQVESDDTSDAFPAGRRCLA